MIDHKEVIRIATKYDKDSPGWVSCGVMPSDIIKGTQIELDWIITGKYNKNWPNDVPDLEIAVNFAIARLIRDRWYYNRH